MIEPMLATLVREKPNLSGTWLIEPKYDGERLIAEGDENKISLWTRRHIEVSSKFPEIVEALKNNIKSDNWVLDGELTVEGGFRQLLKRNVEDKFKISILSRKIPATYNLFDILQLEDEDLLSIPLIERKEKLLKAVHFDETINIVPFQEVNSETWKEKFNDYLKQGFEGTVIKNTYSEYESGKRSSNWLKVKKQDTIDVYVVGATKSEGSIPFGALILKKDGKFFGKVGTGFSDHDRKFILKILEKNRAPLNIELPPDVKSEVLVTTKPLLAEIRVQEIIKGSPRAPVWVRFRWG
jgi:DNA ligase-1